MRGLVNFITALRNSESWSEREHRIKQELSKIRLNFSKGETSGYDKKKNILKLLYIKMIGYEFVDLGYLESVQLLGSASYQERAIGYMGCETLLGEVKDVRRLCTNTILDHLSDKKDYVVSLALAYLANSGCAEVNERIFPTLIKISVKEPLKNENLRKMVYTCLLQSFRLNPQFFDLEEWKTIIPRMLEHENSISCVSGVSSLLFGFLRVDPKGWDNSISLLIAVLSHILSSRLPRGYIHSGMPAPFVTVKILSIVHHYYSNNDYKGENVQLLQCIEVLLEAINGVENFNAASKISRDNYERKLAQLSLRTIQMAIFKEIVKIVTGLNIAINDSSIETITSRLMSSKASFARLLGLESLEAFLGCEHYESFARSNLTKVIKCLNEKDPTIIKQAIMVVCEMCNSSNWQVVMPELYATLKFSCASLQEFMIPFIMSAIDRSLPKNSFFVDSTFNLVASCAPQINVYSVWDYLVTTLKNSNNELRKKVASKCASILSVDDEVPDGLLCICVYVLGEYGHLIANSVKITEQIDLLKKFHIIGSSRVRGLILDAYGKLGARDTTILSKIEGILELYIEDIDLNVQLRSCELLRLLQYRDVYRSAVLDKQTEINVPAVGTDQKTPITGEYRDFEQILDNKPGLIFRNEWIHVIFYQSYKSIHSRVMLRINNSGSEREKVIIRNVRLKCPVGIAGEYHNEISDTVLKPQEQICHKLSFTLHKEYINWPEYVIEYSAKGTRTCRIKLPILLHKFMSKLYVDAEDGFLSLWDSMESTHIERTMKYEGSFEDLVEGIESYTNMNTIAAEERNVCVGSSVNFGYDKSAIICLGLISSDLDGRKVSVHIRGTSKTTSSSIMESIMLLINNISSIT